MFKHLIPATPRKIMRHIRKKGNIHNFIKDNTKQIIYRRYPRGKIHAIDF
jgi:hypothetical protein